MNRNLKFGIIGATGAVGRRIVQELLVAFPEAAADLKLFSSAKSAGTEINFNGASFTTSEFSLKAVEGLDCVLISAGGPFSREWSELIAAQGIAVIDNSSAFRMDPSCLLVVPGVNDGAIKSTAVDKRIFPVANCSTIQLVMCLAPLVENFGLNEVEVSTYQSVSGAGAPAMGELRDQWSALIAGEKPNHSVLPMVIASDLIPAIDTLDDAGHCFEETKMILETRKILEKPDLPVFATTIRVPTIQGHGESVKVKLGKKVSRDQVISVFEATPKISVSSENAYQKLPQLSDIVGTEEVAIARVRLPHGDESSETVQFWNIADNLGIGAATTAINLAKLLMAKSFFS